jgi:hypothetical protein
MDNEKKLSRLNNELIKKDQYIFDAHIKASETCKEIK